ncbi:PrpF domain-containing protein [Terrabacter terrigena]|uniref:PrpF domain-containing protein n=1 Tax=Terrabacter terrigena TaxID=574718 RepID=A0ABW3MS93_9MICO
MSAVPATWMRGGTSKCWVFRRADLDVPGRTLDATLLDLFGSPDPRQIDGVGGATSTTSKAVILSPSRRPDIDVEYTFAQVGIDEAKVDWGSNCGNCSAVVAPFAVREGWVTPSGEHTRVRVLNTNTGQVMVQDVRTRDGLLDETPTTTIPGVTVPGPRVDLGFVSPAGRSTGSLFPTGSPVDALTARGVRVEASLVDAGAPVVIVDATALDLTARETPAQLDAQLDLLASLDAIRRAGAVAMGLADAPDLAERAVPKLALVAAPDAAERSGGADLVVRMLSMGRVHPALPITGSVALTLAAREAGTVVSRLLGGTPVDADEFTMLTPAGPVTTTYSLEAGEPVVAAVRTYRRLVEGSIELPTAAAASPEPLRVIA